MSFGPTVTCIYIYSVMYIYIYIFFVLFLFHIKMTFENQVPSVNIRHMCYRSVWISAKTGPGCSEHAISEKSLTFEIFEVCVGGGSPLIPESRAV